MEDVVWNQDEVLGRLELSISQQRLDQPLGQARGRVPPVFAVGPEYQLTQQLDLGAQILAR